jgi:hypothetical protein
MLSAHRWLPAVGLAALLLLVSAAGCGSSDGGPGSYQAVKRAADEAEETLKSKGGTLERKSYPLGSAWAVDLSGCEIDETVTSALENLDHLAELNLKDAKLMDADLERIAGLKNSGFLTDVDLSGTAVTDAGLMHLAEKGFLTKLSVSGSQVTDAGIKEWEQQRASNPSVKGGFKKVAIQR